MSLVVLAAFVISNPAVADPAYQVPVGPRGIGMGSAFSAIADDASALFWNPAGLNQIRQQEFTGSYANLFQADIKDNLVAFVVPLSRRHAFAIDWYHSGFDDSELSFGENRLDIGYAFRVHRMLSVGLTAKYLGNSIDLDGTEVVHGTGSGYGLDLGALASPYSGLRLGIVAQDVFDTEIESSDGTKSLVYPRNVRGAVAYTWRERVTGAFDVDDRWHLGTEVRVLEPLTLRLGIEDDRHGGESATWSAGFGLAVGPLRFDYARADHPTLDATQHFGVSVAFNFNPAQIRIEKVEAGDLYASLYRSCAQSPLGKVVVRNLQDRPLQARVRVEVRGLSDAPSEQLVLLRPRATQEIPLTVVLSDRVLEQSGDRPRQVVVAASYESMRLPRTETASTRLVAYGPGAIDWSRGVAQAAAYVTTRDPVVADLGREVSRLVALQPEDAFGNRNVATAAALFEALGVLGVAYVPDPNNPFAVMSETPHAIDTVHYPRETLTSRAGDCDDSSVLVAALLGSVGIETAFVDVPQHLFVLADTGLHARHRAALGLDEQMLAVRDERVWIPIETTAIGRGFTAAWEEGAKRYHEYAERSLLQVVEVGAAQQQYPPAEPLGEVQAPSVDADLVRDRIASAGTQVAAWREAHLAARYGGARSDLAPSPAALLEVAQVYLEAGRVAAARERLDQALALAPASAAVHNDLALARAATGDIDSALVELDAALRADPADGGVWLNLGLLRHVSGDSAGAVAALREGVAKSGGWDAACQLLGLGHSNDSRRAQGTSLTPEEARELLRLALEKVPVPTTSEQVAGGGAATGGPAASGAPGSTATVPPATPPAVSASPGATAKPPAGEPPQHPRARVGASRGGLDLQVHRVMYWKEWNG